MSGLIGLPTNSVKPAASSSCWWSHPRRRRDREDRQPFEPLVRQGADLPRGGVAVQLRHVQIHQHQVVVALLDPLDGLPAVRSRRRTRRPTSRRNPVRTSTLTSLSSATRTLRPSAAPGSAARPPGRPDPSAATVFRRRTNENVVPRPSSLSTAIRLPCSSTSFLLIAKPEAGAAVLQADVVAGLREVVEDVRQPVRRDPDPGVGDPEIDRYGLRRPAPGPAASPSPIPAPVNLMALPSRLVSTWPILTGSPSRAAGTRSSTCDLERQAFLLGLHVAGRRRFRGPAAGGRSSSPPGTPCPPRSC